MTYSPPCCIISLHTKIHERGVLYVRLIIQQKKFNWSTFSIFLHLFWNFFCTNHRNPVFVSAFYDCIGIHKFHSFSVSAFSFWHYGKITECVLFCLLLCKSRLFSLYECNCFHGFETHSKIITTPACIFMCWRYHGFKIRKKIWRCFHTVWSCGT